MVPASNLAGIQPDGVAEAEQTYVAPSPDTILAPRQHGIDAQDQGPACAALLRKEHAAEVARLTQELRDLKQAHLAAVERLRAEHATDVQRLVEALWQAQDAARAASAAPDSSVEAPALEPQSAPELQPKRSRAGLARFMGCGALSPPRRGFAALGRIWRGCVVIFRAWS